MPLSSILVILLGVLAIVWFGQRSLVYFPMSNVPSPASAGLLAAEIADLTTRDGLTLGAWFVPARHVPSGYTTIVFNGNGGHRGDRAALANALSRAGIAVLLFDYRGYGGNPGLPNERGFARDARAALAYLRSRPDVDARRIVFFGESLGAAVAVGLATEFAPAALILRSPFSSLQAMARTHLAALHVPRWLMRDHFDALRCIVSVTSPLLVIAGDEDQTVPIDDSLLLFEQATDPKRLVVVEGADHNDARLVHGPAVIEAVTEWLGFPRT